MELLPSLIEAYIESHTEPEPAHLAHLNRETHLKVLYPRMLSGHVQGRFLAMISKMLRPSRILEVGTFTGYATICMAEGLADGGTVITLEKDPELELFIRKGLADAGIEERVELKFGMAAEIIPTLSGPFDLIFIDADKQNYPLYYELCLSLLSERGVLLVDNVLWGGDVVKETSKSKELAGIKAFNDLVAADPNVEQVMVPVRDGIMMIRRKM